jgi:hypothetical protein
LAVPLCVLHTVVPLPLQLVYVSVAETQVSSVVELLHTGVMPLVHEPVQTPPSPAMLLHANWQVSNATHCPLALHVWRVVVELGVQRVVPGVHAPQTPAPLHTPAVPLLQAVPAETGVKVGVGPLHDGVVQPPVVSTGRLLVFAAVIGFPFESQTSMVQVCCGCDAAGNCVPAGAATNAQVPPMHACNRHGIDGIGQSLGSMHDIATEPMSPVGLPPARSAELMSTLRTLMSVPATAGALPVCQQVLSLAQ